VNDTGQKAIASKSPGLLAAAILAGAQAALGQGGEILWKLPYSAPSGGEGLAPRRGPDGAIYWVAHGFLFKGTPSGSIIWQRPNVLNFDFGAPDRIYVGGTTDGVPSIRALTLDNQVLWSFAEMGTVTGIIGGPNVGPDGNIYATAKGGINGPGFGTFSLTPSGAFRWNTSGFGNSAGLPSSTLVFGGGLVFKSEDVAPTGPGTANNGLVAMRMSDGEIQWTQGFGVASHGPGRQPQINPVTGKLNIIAISPGNFREAREFSLSGAPGWVRTGGGVTELNIANDGNIYYFVTGGNLQSLSPSGQIRWVAVAANQQNFPTQAVPSPDGEVVVFANSACFGSACPPQVVAYNTANGSERWRIELPNESTGMPTVYTSPTFSPDSSVVYILAFAFTTSTQSYLYAICAKGDCSPACYANCDASTGSPILNVADFTCFLNKYASGDNYANCDGSTGHPVLNVADFSCFLSKFAAGCP
jgi:hypothetical protein